MNEIRGNSDWNDNKYDPTYTSLTTQLRTGPRHARRRYRDPRTLPLIILALEMVALGVLLAVAPW